MAKYNGKLCAKTLFSILIGYKLLKTNGLMLCWLNSVNVKFYDIK